MKIYCCGCEKEVEANLIKGEKIYKGTSPYCYELPFWQCPTCENYVGCHYKTEDPTKPLGCIPTPEIREIRGCIHDLLEHFWLSGRMARSQVYTRISKMLGYRYHTGNIKSLKEITPIRKAARKLWLEIE